MTQPSSAKSSMPPEKGVIFYTRPEDLKIEQIDPLLRPAVLAINSSRWVWTGESCQGHPDAAKLGDTGWTHNTEPYLRLICRRSDMGRMLTALVEASAPTVEDQDLGIFSAAQLRVIRSNDHPEWAEVMVYIGARNVMDRDFGCRVFSRFGEVVEGARPCGRLIRPSDESLAADPVCWLPAGHDGPCEL
jgi:hypothetical protein